MIRFTSLEFLKNKTLTIILIRAMGAGSIALVWYFLAIKSGPEAVAGYAKIHSQIFFLFPLVMLGKDLISYRRSARYGVLNIQYSDLLLYLIGACVVAFVGGYFEWFSYSIVWISTVLSLIIYLSEAFRVKDHLYAYSFFKYTFFNSLFSISVILDFFLGVDVKWLLSVVVPICLLVILLYLVVRGYVELGGSVSVFSTLPRGALIYLPQSASSLVYFLIYNGLGIGSYELGQFSLSMVLVSILTLIQTSTYSRYSNKLVVDSSNSLFDTYWRILKESTSLNVIAVLMIFLSFYVAGLFYELPLDLNWPFLFLVVSQLVNVIVGPAYLLLNLRGFELGATLSSIFSMFVVFACVFYSGIESMSPFYIYGLYVFVSNSMGVILLIILRKRVFCE